MIVTKVGTISESGKKWCWDSEFGCTQTQKYLVPGILIFILVIGVLGATGDKK